MEQPLGPRLELLFASLASRFEQEELRNASKTMRFCLVSTVFSTFLGAFRRPTASREAC